MRLTLSAASAALAVALLGTPSALADQGVTDTEILLGEVEPLSGPPALLGLAHNIGVRLAIEEANANGGVAGRQLRLIAEDDGYVTSRTIQSLKKLIHVDKVFALTALSGSGQAIASIPVVKQAGIPSLVPIGPVTPLYTPPVDNIFVVGQAYETGMQELALFLAKKFPGKKWGVVTQDDDYGIALREGLEAAKAEEPFDVVFETVYKRGQKDFSSEMLRAKDAGVEVMIAGGIISENVAMVKEMEKLGIKPITGIFWPGRVSVVLKLMGAASDGIYAVDYVEPLGGPAGQAFVEKAKTYMKPEEVSGMNRYTMTGYAATRVLIEAMRSCEADLSWACVNEAMAETEGLETGVMGPIGFADGGRFSNQALRIMQADFETLSFKPVE